MNEQTSPESLSHDTVVATDAELPRAVRNAAREAASMVPVTSRGLNPLDLAQLFDVAKAMAEAGPAIPKHLRKNPGACLAIIERATEWGLAPYGVASQSYVVNDMLCFMSQVWVAVANKHAGLKGILRPHYEGEGPTRVCIVNGHVKGEVDPLEYRSPPIGKITPKNSPLWVNDPDQQLWYFSARAFCRRYFPHIMLGVYGKDELEDNPELSAQYVGPEGAKDVTPVQSLAQRLAAAAHSPDVEARDGFRPGVVEDGINGKGEEEHDPETGEIRQAARSEPQGEAGKPRRGTDTPRKEKRTGKARKGKAEASEPKPEKPAKPVKPVEPRNPRQYGDHVERWLAELQTEEEIEKRWSSEMKLRNACGMTMEERKPIRAVVDARIAELSGKSE